MKNYKKRVLGLVLGGRIKSVGVILFTGVLPVAAATFPLEWNATYDTSVPREVEILPAKLAGMGLMRAGDGFKVLADGQPLAVKALDGKEPGSVRLRFTVPSGTKALTCETCADGAKLHIGAAKFMQVEDVYVDGVRQDSASVYTALNADWITSTSLGRVGMRAGTFFIFR